MVISYLLFLFAAGILIFGAAWLYKNRRPAWLPAHMHAATELPREKSISAIINGDEIVGRMDRHWRMPNGDIVVADYKTRSHHRVYDTDRLQLSIEAAILRRNGFHVSDTGGVIINANNNTRWHDAPLLSDKESVAEISAYKALLSGQMQGRRPRQKKKCLLCAHKAACDQMGQ